MVNIRIKNTKNKNNFLKNFKIKVHEKRLSMNNILALPTY